MGCGGFGGFFSPYYYYPRRECSHGENEPYYREQNDTEEKLLVLKRMYAEGIIDEEGYRAYKQRILEGSVDFEDLMEIRKNHHRAHEHHMDENHQVKPESKSKYQIKLDTLKQSRGKILEIKQKLSEKIKELTREKEAMEKMAETVLKAGDQKAEEFISKKLELEETLQNLIKRDRDLQKEVDRIDTMVNMLNIKQLELEAMQMQEEISNVKMALDENS
jgi:hypothetical protein